MALIKITELPQLQQEPFRQWLAKTGHTQIVVDEKNPHAYIWSVDYEEWLRTLLKKNEVRGDLG